MTNETPISWRALETAAGLDGLGELHRSFLTVAGVPGAETLNLRRAQQRAEAELNRLAQAGTVQKMPDDWHLPASLVQQFAPELLPQVIQE